MTTSILKSSIIDEQIVLHMSCPVCFGAVEPAVRESLNAGIFVLLAVTLGVLGCFARFFLTLARRAREAGDSHGAPAAVPESGRV